MGMVAADPTLGPDDPKPGPDDPKPGPDDPKPGPDDPKLGIEDPKLGVEDPKLGVEDPKLGVCGPGIGVEGNANVGTGFLKSPDCSACSSGKVTWPSASWNASACCSGTTLSTRSAMLWSAS